jgi:hypothetical protein
MCQLPFSNLYPIGQTVSYLFMLISCVFFSQIFAIIITMLKPFKVVQCHLSCVIQRFIETLKFLKSKQHEIHSIMKLINLIFVSYLLWAALCTLFQIHAVSSVLHSSPVKLKLCTNLLHIRHTQNQQLLLMVKCSKSQKFQYLDSTLSRATHIDEEVVCRIAKASIAFGKLRKTVCER